MNDTQQIQQTGLIKHNYFKKYKVLNRPKAWNYMIIYKINFIFLKWYEEKLIFSSIIFFLWKYLNGDITELDMTFGHC